MSKTRSHVLAASAAGQPIHQTAQFFSESLGVPLEEAVADLDALVALGVLKPRFWVHCPECGSGVVASETVESSRWERCDACGFGFNTEGRLTKAYVLPAKNPTRIEDLDGLAPGPDLDLLVAMSQGMVACGGWTLSNLGSAGGPVLTSMMCFHAAGACWPDVSDGLGGVPKFSTQRQHLSLADLPRGTVLRYDGYAWYVRVPGVVEIHARTEPHALSLAMLASQQPAKWTDENRWRVGWREYAAENGIDPTDEPWTPELLHLLRSYASVVSREASDEVSGRKIHRIERDERQTLKARLTEVPPAVLTRITAEAREAGLKDGVRAY